MGHPRGYTAFLLFAHLLMVPHKLRMNAVFLSDRLGDLAGPFSLISAVIPIGLLVGTLIWIPSTGSGSGAGPSAAASSAMNESLRHD